MAFEITTFTTRLKDLFLNSPLMPEMKGEYLSSWGVWQNDKQKHPKREYNLKKSIENSMNASQLQMQDIISFDIGNEKMERENPYYHILENTPYIRKAYQGSEKSRGSQAKIENVGERNYERVDWNGKTFTQEYRKNIRGKRNRLDKVSRWIYGDGFRAYINRESNSYLNIHYQYIERILDSGILETLASEQGLRVLRKKDLGLDEEYFSQFDEMPSNILEIIGSHD
jgi:hypothetical protein